MSVTPQASRLMARRDELTDTERALIEAVFDTIYSAGVPAAKDDRAAELEAALIAFLFASREET